MSVPSSIRIEIGSDGANVLKLNMGLLFAKNGRILMFRGLLPQN